MKLYHNADIADINAILKNGLLPMDITGNDKWECRRADNRTDVVYLSSPIGKQNSFVNYGICLIEVVVDDAEETKLEKNDVNKDNYREYIISMVKPEQIKAVYIPEIFRDKAEKYINDFDKVRWCKMYAEEITGTIEHSMFNVELIYSPISNERLEIFGKTAKIEVMQYGYFRGLNTNGTVFDIYNVRYDIN